MYEDGYFMSTKEDFKQEWIREAALKILVGLAAGQRAMSANSAIRLANNLWNKTMEDKNDST